MDVLDFSQLYGSRPLTVDYLPQLIGSVGQADFQKNIAQFAKELFAADHLTAFVFSKNSAPRPVVVSGSVQETEAQAASHRYITDHWLNDPSNRFVDFDAGNLGRRIVIMSAEDAPTEGFRRDCFAATKIKYRLSIIHDVRDEFIKLSFHRPIGSGQFTEDVVNQLAGISDVICSLLIKHEQFSSAVSHLPESMEAIERRLVRYCAELTPRELSVAALIVRGLSSEGIALELGVSINTVLTFRRRAYARLKISSQNELIHLAYH